MFKKEYLDRLLENAYVDLFLAGCDGARLDVPCRMARDDIGGGSLSHAYEQACDTYWVDSAIGDPDYGNRDVLDDAHEYNADAALLADTMGDFDQTVTSLLEGLEIADDHPFEGDIIVPLQEPYDECYREFEDCGDKYAIGGLKDAIDIKRIEAAREVREVAGYDIHLHGLGWGPHDNSDEGLTRAIHRNPDLIDSMDYSTPVQNSVDAMPGDERMSVVAAEAVGRLVRDLRRLTPNVDFEPEPSELRTGDQSGLDESTWTHSHS